MLKTERPILLIEDNPMDVDLTCRAFKRSEVSNPIQVARDGEEALSTIRKWDNAAALPAVILLDLKLPKIDGFEVLRQIKKHPHYRMIPVVVFSSSDEGRDILSAYQNGANSYIVKPVDFDRFLEIAQHIDQYWIGVNFLPR
jgi:CheY-like chemotaxis protein